MSLKHPLILGLLSVTLSIGFSPKLLSQSEVNPISFDQFPVETIFSGSPAILDLSSHPNARQFRTVLKQGAEQGINFAGHYTIVTWGCGTACQVLAVIDVKTGQIYFPEIVASVGFEYRSDSSLLVVNPAKNLEEIPELYQQAYGPSRYYQWQNNQFIPLCNSHEN